MATIDRDYVGKERQRQANLIAGIGADVLWTELRDRNATAENDPHPTFREVNFDELIRLRGIDIHRAFSVRIISSPAHNLQTIGATHDVDVHTRIQIARYIGGGARLPFPSSAPLADEVSAQDSTRIVQRLTDPANKTQGLTGPIYTDLPTEARRVMVTISEESPELILDETASEGGRQIWQILATAWIRTWTEAA